MYKQKQIEELAKDIGIAFQLAGTTRFGAVAEILVDKWQRKIPENAVVLTKEEYEKLLDVRTDVILKDIDKVFKEEFEDTKRSVERKIKPIYKAIETRTRKETAEKFAQALENRLDSIDTILHEDNEEEYLSANELGKLIDEICKEITEGKV